MIHDRGKSRNLILNGPVNRAKNFLLKPLKSTFCDSIFENPVNDKYAWIGADKANINNTNS